MRMREGVWGFCQLAEHVQGLTWTVVIPELDIGVWGHSQVSILCIGSITPTGRARVPVPRRGSASQQFQAASIHYNSNHVGPMCTERATEPRSHVGIENRC